MFDENCVLFLNDNESYYGDERKIRDYFLTDFPDLGQRFDIVGGKRPRWDYDAFLRELGRANIQCQKVIALVVSERIGVELLGDVVRLGIRRHIPTIILGQETVVHTVSKTHMGKLALRDSIIGDPILDIPVQDLSLKKQRTKTAVNNAVRAGQLQTVGDVVRKGRQGLAAIDGFGPLTIGDLARVIKDEFQVDIPA